MSNRTVSARLSTRQRSGLDALREEDATDLSPVQTVPVEHLLPADSPRTAGENAEHVQVLVQSVAVLPPIIVHRASMRVVDGAHRLRAAVERGDEVVQVRFFEGSARDAFLVAVRENTAHGLPLSMRDRLAAARRILSTHPHWSDRAIAELAGLSPKTMGELRRAAPDEGVQPTVRMGRDGRIRPVDGSAGRLRAARLVAEEPEASLRDVARRAGISPGTVRDVRARLSRGEDPVPGSARRDLAASESATVPPAAPGSAGSSGSRPLATGTEPVASGRSARRAAALTHQRYVVVGKAAQTVANPTDAAELLAVLGKDPSLRYAEQGRLMLRLLSPGALPARLWNDLDATVPDYSVDSVSRLARASAEALTQFADRLERRQDRSPV
ncbi:ParB N-terminal domain-containing protein [Streptomyces sp. OM5714]|uniref:ParB/RepB/Spo0J family partition protein n=1 Tax=Streptomyces sp. OM5714 TaxID=2602736 RepID=UPI0013D97CE5|nr:ParB N-terminal domain-containing protein [Streptomyces sp. OM5714]